MQKTCKRCSKTYEVTADDLAFYDHISPVFAGKKCPIPPPKECPTCRQRDRLAFRSQTALFQRTAYPRGETIFSMYPESAPFPVMKNEDWFGESWDGIDYAQNYVENKPFLAQLLELNAVVPRYVAVNNIRTENCEYCNNVSDIRNCYLVFSTSYAEDCMYGENIWASKDCIENTLTLQSELCYDCTNCTRCTRLQSSFNSENCSDSFFLTNCRNCHNCFGCVNLRNKSYCIWNEQKSKAEYESFLRTFTRTSFREREHYAKAAEEIHLQHPRPHTIMHQTENCTGNCILESRNVTDSHFIQYGEDLKHCFNVYDKTNDCRDFTFFGRTAELIYASSSCGIQITRLCFCFLCRNQSSDLFYCISCDACRDCFGCIGLWRKQYCILNKQYTKSAYEALVPKIIAHMEERGEWGEYFPMSFNPIPYNRSLAHRYYPLSENEAKKQGYSWYEEDIRDFPDAMEASLLPDGLPNSNDPLTVKSTLSGRPFRITTQEIERYRELHYERQCAKTGKNILTPYPPDSPYIIWDREEYEKEFQ